MDGRVPAGLFTLWVSAEMMIERKQAGDCGHRAWHSLVVYCVLRLAVAPLRIHAEKDKSDR